MGEWPVETGVGSVLEFIQANKWDSVGDGTGDPRPGMYYYNTATGKYRYADATGTWISEHDASFPSDVIQDGDVLFVEDGRQYLVYGKLTLDGEYRIDGTGVVL